MNHLSNHSTKQDFSSVQLTIYVIQYMRLAFLIVVYTVLLVRI